MLLGNWDEYISGEYGSILKQIMESIVCIYNSTALLVQSQVKTETHFPAHPPSYSTDFLNGKIWRRIAES